MSQTTRIKVDISAVQDRGAIIGEVSIKRLRTKYGSRCEVGKLLYVVDVEQNEIMLHGCEGVVFADSPLAVDEIRNTLQDMEIDGSMFSVRVA